MVTKSNPTSADHEHEPCCEGIDSPCYICQPNVHNCSPTCRLHTGHPGYCLHTEVYKRPLVLSILMVLVLGIFIIAAVLAVLD